MVAFWQSAFALIKQTVREVIDDDVPSMSAAIAYYTLFSLPPLLIMIIGLAGIWLGADTVREGLVGQVGGVVGREGAEVIQTMVEQAGDLGASTGAKLVGLTTLLIGATGAFGALQNALNRAWEVEAKNMAGLRMLVMKRIVSFGMVLTLGFFLLVSLVLSTLLAMLGEGLAANLPLGIPPVVWEVVNTLASFSVIAGLIAVIFKVLPDADVTWRDVGVGAIVTALLFTLGKWALGLYLGRSDPGSAFGAAGSLALILVWIYYSALIVLAGAEFTQAYACRFGSLLCEDQPDTHEQGTSTEDADR